MANIKFTNFAHSQLAAGIGPGTTLLSVTGGHGARFPTLGTGEYFYATLEDATLNREVIKVTARVGDNFTVVRGQDNTSPLAWVAGDSIALRLNAAAINDVIDETLNKVDRTTATGSAILPSGTEAQRDASPAAGYIRFNTDIDKFEGYNGTSWSSVGGGATGGGSDAVFIENDQTVNSNYTIPATKNAMSTGPITVADGVTVTVSDGARWVVL